MMRSVEARSERWLLGAAAVAVLLVWAPLPARSPDGLEMLALAASWRGEGPTVDRSFWPPLWPGLVAALGGLGLERAAWWLNLVLAGAVVVPLARMAHHWGGTWAQRSVAVAWPLLPAVREHAAVLDARPLGWWLTAWSVALAVEAADGRRPWWHALLPAALAPLARPEGAALVPLITVAALVLGGSWRRVVPAAALALVPTVLLGAVRESGRFAWGALWVPWSESWVMSDFLALFGNASAGTGYRDFAANALAAGLEAPPSALSLLLRPPMEGAPYVLGALLQCTGVVLAVAALLGGAALIARARRPRRAIVVAGLSLSPLVALAFTPMITGPSTPAANLLFVAAPMVAVGLSAWRRWGARIPVVLVLLGVAEATWGPMRGPAPFYLEDSAAAETLSLWLQEHPPASGRVACTLSGRGVAVRAGLVPVSLPSTWEQWAPEPGDGVLLTQVDFRGEDGGRGLALLEGGRWRPVWVASDGVLAWWDGLPVPTEDTWLVYLEAAP